MQKRSIKLFLIRHCEDVASQMGKFEDLKLTINGESQAREIAKFLKSEALTSIFTSPMERAKQTAQIISQDLELSIIESDLLKDRDVGTVAGMSYEKVQKQYSQLLSQSTFSSGFKFPGGETNGEVFQRAQQFIDKYINTSGGTNQSILIVSHSLTLNYLIYILQNLGFQDELLYLFEYGMGCIINKEYGKLIFRMIEFTNFYGKSGDMASDDNINSNP
ncbi:MAG: histidine phosphatase family protein [Candidatus Heimdallarchaeota archaeon]|nr:histidine phosphatase family protein [Candidatus Heimdallarchaeota archaeon]